MVTQRRGAIRARLRGRMPLRGTAASAAPAA